MKCINCDTEFEGDSFFCDNCRGKCLGRKVNEV